MTVSADLAKIDCKHALFFQNYNFYAYIERILLKSRLESKYLYNLEMIRIPRLCAVFARFHQKSGRRNHDADSFSI